MGKKFITQQTSAGKPLEIDNLTLYPVARSYRISIPAIRGGFIWNRPLAIIVEGRDGSRQVLPIIDRTRQLQIAIFTAGLAGTLLTWLLMRKSQKTAYKEN